MFGKSMSVFSKVQWEEKIYGKMAGLGAIHSLSLLKNFLYKPFLQVV